MGHITIVYKVNNNEFKTREDAKKYIANELNKDIIREEIDKEKTWIYNFMQDLLIPIFCQGRSIDYLNDNDINNLREKFYNFMILRRKLLNVNLYHKK